MTSPLITHIAYMTDRSGISNPSYKYQKSRRISEDIRKKAEVFRDSYLDTSNLKIKNRSQLSKNGDIVIGSLSRYDRIFPGKNTIIDPVLYQKHDPYRVSSKSKSPKHPLLLEFQDDRIQKEYEVIKQLFKKF